MANKEDLISIELFKKIKDGFYRVNGKSMTRQEAIEKMAKGIHRYKKEGGLFVDGYAEAALNALLER